MIQEITIGDLVKLAGTVPIVDVRTPAEFIHGHIPGASNLPLFSNEERVQVGTTYKQVSREAAILLGFDLTGNKWSGFIRQALEIAPQKKLAVHCWRGGMRSGAMAWALNLYGFELYVLSGGYKRYRRWVLQQFEAPYKLWTIGGMTGSGKTRILQQLGSMGQQVIDLEELARHQGSAYGSLNKLVQPTQEQFENNFALGLNQLDHDRKIWVEDESFSIGKCNIPRPFWDQMQAADLFELQTPAEQRIQALVQEYGSLDKAFLSACTERIRKRLGSEQTKNALTAIDEGRMEDFIRIVLVYYDKTYRKGLNSRKAGRIIPVGIRADDPVANASQILVTAKNLLPLATT